VKAHTNCFIPQGNDSGCCLDMTVQAAAPSLTKIRDRSGRRLLWTKATRTTTRAISASVPAHATVLFRVHAN
jgi:hypothetical protein